MKKSKSTIFLFILMSFIQFSLYGQSNNALHFDGVDDYVECPIPVDGKGDFTFEAWFQTESINDMRFKHLVSMEGNDSKFKLGVINGKITHLVFPNTSSSDIRTVTDHFVGDGQCHHIAAVRLNFDFIIYLDGKQVEYLENHFSPEFNLDKTMLIGRHGDAPKRHWKGMIDDVRVWNKARNAAEIFEYKDRVLQGTEWKLAVNYQFDQGDACSNNSGEIILNDIGPNNLRGKINNFAMEGSTSNWVIACGTETIYFDGLKHTILSNGQLQVNNVTNKISAFICDDLGEVTQELSIHLGQVNGFSYRSSPPDDEKEEEDDYMETKIFGSVNNEPDQLIRTQRQTVVNYLGKRYIKVNTTYNGVEQNQLIITSPGGEELVNIIHNFNQPYYFRVADGGGSPYWPETSIEHQGSRSNDDHISFLPPGEDKEVDVPAGSIIEINGVNPPKIVDYYTNMVISWSGISDASLGDERIILFEDKIKNVALGKVKLDAQDGGQRLVVSDFSDSETDGLRIEVIDTIRPITVLDTIRPISHSHENIWESKLIHFREIFQDKDNNKIGQFSLSQNGDEVEMLVDYSGFEGEDIIIKVYDDGKLNTEDTLPGKNLDAIIIMNEMPNRSGYNQSGDGKLIDFFVSNTETQNYVVDGNEYSGNEIHIIKRANTALKKIASISLFPKVDSTFILVDEKYSIVVYSTSATKRVIQADFKIYPNPARDVIVIEGGGVESSKLLLEMFDLHGRSVLSRTYDSFVDKVVVSIRDLKTGLYLLKVTDGLINIDVKVMVMVMEQLN